MRILMMTNTYLPILGGLERSIELFTAEYRRRGHKVMIAAPEFKDQPARESGVIRLPALQKFSKTDFSVHIPIPGLLEDLFDSFKPDIVHAHHPFLVGDLALRLSLQYSRPLVFTYHTMFELYREYFALHQAPVRRFVIRLAAEYANLSDHTIVPSESVGELLRERGVTAPISVVPTGVETQKFREGDGAGFRARYGIPENAFVIGHVGRLAQEKNPDFLAEAVSIFCALHDRARFLLVGSGPAEEKFRGLFRRAGIPERLVTPGVQKGDDLIRALHAMDIFAFSSKSETQGIVLIEAMAAGIPVVALDGPGVREVVRHDENGYLLGEDSLASFVAALEKIFRMGAAHRAALREAARKTAEEFTVEKCADRGMAVYEAACLSSKVQHRVDESPWDQMMNRIKGEWEMFSRFSKATRAALVDVMKGDEEDEAGGKK